MDISNIESATKANPKSVTPRLSEMIRLASKYLKFDTEAVEQGAV
jgi:hypothetical protein